MMAGSVAEERIRAKVEALMRRRFPAARIVHELVLDQGGVRIDLAAVERDRLVVAEIKSERDTLKRLADQVAAAVEVAAEVWIVADEKHHHAIKAFAEPTTFEDLPFPVSHKLAGGGLATTYKVNVPNPEFIPGLGVCHTFAEAGEEIAPAKVLHWDGIPYRLPKLNPRAMLNMLWADELRALVQGGKLPRQASIDLAVETMTGREIRRGVCRMIRSRDFPRADAALKGDAGMTLSDNAKTYALAGIAVFPLQPRDKKPFAHTPGLKAATKDPVRVEQWWSGQLPLPIKDGDRPQHPPYANPRANIGIATGKVSGFWVLDIDGPDGAAALAELEARHGALPPTPEQSTGKGRHICFADPADGPAVRNSASRIGPGIDVRGDGGYIVAAPSIHPSGRVYAWADGKGPGDLAFAAAPAWLLDLASPPVAAPAPAPAKRVSIEGRASRYGEAALTGACRDVENAQPGTQSDTLWDKSVKIGALVAGGEIERAYAQDALINAGLNMVAAKGPWTRAVVESAVTRAFTWAEAHPRGAPELRNPGRSPSATYRKTEPQARREETPRDARSLWAAGMSADQGLVRQFLEGGHGLDLSLAGWTKTVRLLRPPMVPGCASQCLIMAMSAGKGRELDAVALAPLASDGLHITRIIGHAAGRAAVLSPWSDNPAPADVLVGIDLADAWSLGAAAQGSGDPLGVVVAPTLSAFAGAPLGDRFGRISPTTPTVDPAQLAWTVPGQRQVYVAVRNDMFGPTIRARKATGGTFETQLKGEDAAQFFGALASQSWTRAGAAGVRILRPNGGCAGFHAYPGGAA